MKNYEILSDCPQHTGIHVSIVTKLSPMETSFSNPQTESSVIRSLQSDKLTTCCRAENEYFFTPNGFRALENCVFGWSYKLL